MTDRDREWDCPHCGRTLGADEGVMEYTVAPIRLASDAVPRHWVCPGCGQCMKCRAKRSAADA